MRNLQEQVKKAFCYQKFFWLKATFSEQEKLLKFEAEALRTIYSNSQRSEQFIITECFFNLFLEVSHII